MQNFFLPLLFSILFAFDAATFKSLKGQSLENLKDVRVQLIYRHQFQFAGFYAAIEKGYYAEKGLKVHLIDSNFTKGSASIVVNEEAEFGIGSSGLVKKRAEGFPIVLLASIFQHSPQALITADDSGIRNMKDLIGKKVMIEPHATEILAFLNDEGLSNENIMQLPYDFSLKSLISGKVDAMSIYLTDQTYILDTLNFSYQIVSPLSGGIDFYGDSIFTSETFLRENPQLVQDFLDATKKGWNYALANKDEICRLIHQKYNDDISIDHLKYEAQRVKEYVANDVVEVGYYNRGRWEYTMNTYKRLDLIDKDATLDGFFLEDYQEKPINIHWPIVFIVLAVLVFLMITLLYVLSLNRRLRKELNRSKSLEHSLRTSNETKDRLISILAHDLKNPFSGIISLSSLMLLDIENASRKELERSLRLIRKSAEDAYRLLKNLLDWLMIQQDGLKIRPRKVMLSDELSPLIELNTDIATNKKIDFNHHIDADLFVYTDPHMLEVIMRNLIANALKFTAEGGQVDLKIYGLDNGSPSECIRFEIKDTGVGMTEEERHRILYDEHIKSKPGTENEKGTGLGLKISQFFLKEMGSELHIHSTQGIGSTFYFDLKMKVN